MLQNILLRSFNSQEKRELYMYKFPKDFLSYHYYLELPVCGALEGKIRKLCFCHLKKGSGFTCLL